VEHIDRNLDMHLVAPSRLRQWEPLLDMGRVRRGRRGSGETEEGVGAEVQERGHRRWGDRDDGRRGGRGRQHRFSSGGRRRRRRGVGLSGIEEGEEGIGGGRGWGNHTGAAVQRE
jgi:hypothetical protein